MSEDIDLGTAAIDLGRQVLPLQQRVVEMEAALARITEAIDDQHLAASEALDVIEDIVAGVSARSSHNSTGESDGE